RLDVLATVCDSFSCNPAGDSISPTASPIRGMSQLLLKIEPAAPSSRNFSRNRSSPRQVAQNRVHPGRREPDVVGELVPFLCGQCSPEMRDPLRRNVVFTEVSESLDHETAQASRGCH